METPLPDRPDFIAHWTELEGEDDSHYPGDSELMSIGAPLGRALGLTRIGIHHERLPPGRRTCYAHAESAEQLAIARHLVEEQSAALRAALAELPPKCRELLTVLYLGSDEPTYEGVAKRLNMPVSSIGPTRGRCLRKLRRILEDKL